MLFRLWLINLWSWRHGFVRKCNSYSKNVRNRRRKLRGWRTGNRFIRLRGNCTGGSSKAISNSRAILTNPTMQAGLPMGGKGEMHLGFMIRLRGWRRGGRLFKKFNRKILKGSNNYQISLKKQNTNSNSWTIINNISKIWRIK